jgi:hypothetical protein
MSGGDHDLLSASWKVTTSGVLELDHLECSICYSQMRDVSRPLTVVDANGQTCVHNFCTDCLAAYVAAPRAPGQRADCPICRRAIVGVQRNQLASTLVDQLLRMYERHRDSHSLAVERITELSRQLAASRELESSASEVNNLLRRKLEQQKAKLLAMTEKVEQLEAAAAAQAQAQAQRQRQQQVVPVSEPEAPAVVVELASPAALDHSSSSSSMGGSALLSRAVTQLWSWATTSAPSATAFARDLKARYEVFEKRGSKKSSGVFRGADRETGERVALKSVREPADVREVMLLTKMRHAALVRCDGVAFGSGSVVCAVLAPYVEHDLAFAVGAGLARAAAAPRLLRQLARALAYLHAGDVVHRDVQPTSILVSPPPEHALLLAGATYAHSVRPSRAAGVPQRTPPAGWHTAPELLADAAPDLKAADVWSVGAVALFLRLQRAPAADELRAGTGPLDAEPARRPTARRLVRDFDSNDDHDDDQAEYDGAVALAYELQDSCIAQFVAEFAPKLLGRLV